MLFFCNKLGYLPGICHIFLGWRGDFASIVQINVVLSDCCCISCSVFLHIRYQINARTELAVRYNDISPLENHHCAVAFQILAQPECNILSNVNQEQFKQIRQVRVSNYKISFYKHLCN